MEWSGYVLLIMSLITIYSHYNQYIVIEVPRIKRDKQIVFGAPIIDLVIFILFMNKYQKY